jgi:hypothetical protein
METCKECGAVWPDNKKSCLDAYYQFLFWENEGGDSYWAVHQLMVLCYHMQHPGILSMDWLVLAKQMLAEFVDQHIDPGEMRQKIQDSVNSNQRSWKIKATPENYGFYDPPIQWKMTSADIYQQGKENYPENVLAWAASVLSTLRETGQM